MEAQLALLREQLREERQRRENAEALTKPTDLPTFLLKCHTLSLAINVVTDPTQTTKGDTANATRRYFPSQIIPWDGFIDEQACIWDRFHQHPSFMLMSQFPSSHQLDYVLTTIRPITAEMDLRYYERDTVENQVQMVVNAVYMDDLLKQAFELAGSVTFESHTNLGASKQSQPVEEGMQHLSIDTNKSTTENSGSRKGKQKPTTDNIPIRGQADRFCVYRRGNGEDVPAIAIEYKAPHKLTCEEIATGLAQEIRPTQDVINKEEDSAEFYSKRLVTVVVTQLFSYMIGKGVQYGYICTGEVFVFLHIPKDPSVVRYAICVPNLDVQVGHEEDFKLTAVAQVVAFTLRALAAPPPPQEWHDAARELGIWPVEYSEILAQTPPGKRLKGRKAPLSAYRGKKSDLPPFHMILRSCRPTENRLGNRSPSPPAPDSPSPANRRSSTRGNQPVVQARGQRVKSQGQGRSGGQGKKTSMTMQIKDRPYCSQECLLGLRDGGPLDPSCPNFQDHRGKAPPSRSFLKRIRCQLAVDRGDNADCRPLYKAGSYGALFKVRLSSHGFTLVAKGARRENLSALLHEREVYDKLRTIQGHHVPVCLGVVRLEPKRPYYYDEGRYTHMLLLSWAGRSISEGLGPMGPSISSMVKCSIRAIHRQGVLHGDAEPRNILWNDINQRLMIVDFGQASIRHPLSSVSPNSSKRRLPKAKVGDAYTVELRTVQASIGAFIRNREM
ncbi:uncharacterized protein CIMG_04845 [Coccidioides immitis RS]|uniref:Protein kinase domain-containing protein n=1 Tax=Coccidioides immitis (strain RS) TaxID=246410 RepID=J3KEC8_COCIM|nr:uncharacterized protein CIMG_04845 [Coccidioides immitis RS]EAS33821.3 hypothetical protein CIMG_04845 [Coccidioides immitis RS]TPX21444.1 hypothetical protein DIZ76_015401 [Coccidioides immitis]